MRTLRSNQASGTDSVDGPKSVSSGFASLVDSWFGNRRGGPAHPYSFFSLQGANFFRDVLDVRCTVYLDGNFSTHLPIWS